MPSMYSRIAVLHVQVAQRGKNVHVDLKTKTDVRIA